MKWQANDDYVQVSKDYLIHGKFPKEVDYQRWLSTVSQQLELDDYGILYRRCPDSDRRVIYVPDRAQEVVVREVHTQPVGNHPSAPKTLARLKWHFYWPQMATDCHKYCTSCIICAGRKGQGRQKKAPLKNITPPDHPMDLVTIDILNLGGTPSGNCKALVAVDYLSKFVFLEPMQNEEADVIMVSCGTFSLCYFVSYCTVSLL